jgi:hypothetical protein
VSNISNPIDIGKLKSDIVSQVIAHVNAKTTETKAHVTTKSTSVKTLVSTENDATQETLGQLTTVNGQIDTNVQAVNTHVSAQADRVLANIPSNSPIKSIQRGVTTASSVTISPVNLAKSTITSSVANGYNVKDSNYVDGLSTRTACATLASGTRISITQGNNPWSNYGNPTVAWEVIEYV